jgi:predicted alpha/beta hydrolase
VIQCYLGQNIDDDFVPSTSLSTLLKFYINAHIRGVAVTGKVVSF